MQEMTDAEFLVINGILSKLAAKRMGLQHAVRCRDIRKARQILHEIANPLSGLSESARQALERLDK